MIWEQDRSEFENMPLAGHFRALPRAGNDGQAATGRSGRIEAQQGGVQETVKQASLATRAQLQEQPGMFSLLVRRYELV